MAHEHLVHLTGTIIGCAIEVHKALGPGYAERVYARALRLSFRQRGIPHTTEQAVRLEYLGQFIGRHRLDLVVADLIIVELKAAPVLTRAHIAQLVSYLRSSKKPLGLLLNFSHAVLQIKRVVC